MRATNWLGDAVMSLPAIRAIRQVFPHAHIAVLARPSVADLYARETAIDQVIVYPASGRRECAGRLRAERFDGAILLQNAFDAALIVWLAGIPERIGYRRDGRGMLLTRAIPVPEPGDIPRHERFYYLELLRRAGLIERFPESNEIRLDGIGAAREAGAAHLSALGVIGAGDRDQSGRGVRRRQALAAGAVRGERAAACRHDWGIGPGVRIGGGARIVRECGRGYAARRNRCEKPGRRDEPAGVHRPGGGVPDLSDQRFRSDARCLRARCPDGGGIRRYGRYDYGADRGAGTRGPRTCRVQPVPAAGVPDRSPVYDTRDGGTCHRGGFNAVRAKSSSGSWAGYGKLRRAILTRRRGAAERTTTRARTNAETAEMACAFGRSGVDCGERMDTRTKIVSPEAAPRGCTVVSGTFDVLHGRRRSRAGGDKSERR